MSGAGNKFSEAVARYTESLPGKIEKLRSLYSCALEESEFSPQCYADILAMLHTFSGTAPTLGYTELGAKARDIEQRLRSAPLEDAHGVDFHRLLKGDIDELQSLSLQPPNISGLIKRYEQKTKISSDHHFIYALKSTDELDAFLTPLLDQLHYQLVTFSTIADLNIGIRQKQPDVLILEEIDFKKCLSICLVEKNGTNGSDSLPIIFIGRANTWQDRLEAFRLGGVAYFNYPVDLDELADCLEKTLTPSFESRYRILVVDDDTHLSNHYSSVLQVGGMDTCELNDPSKLLDVIAEFSPDLILMDISMPGCSGIEAAAIVRQQSRYTNLPIVYLSAEKTLNQQLAALRAGGDEFLHKPIGEFHLQTAVSIRAKRFREINALLEKDGLTGLLNHTNIKLALGRELAGAQRQGKTLALAMIDIDHFKSVNDLYGHLVGDRVIRSLGRLFSRRLRKSDIAGRYGGEEFVVILPYTDIVEAEKLINELRVSFSKLVFNTDNGELNATFSAGISVSGLAQSAEMLLSVTDTALYKAKESGRNCVVVSSVDE